MTVYRDLPRTLLPLDRWAQIIGLDPRYFRQVQTAAKPVNSCTRVWKQYSWQEADQVGRYDVAEAIKQAEDTIAQYLGYKLLPVWEYAERVKSPQPADPYLFRNVAYDGRGYHLAVKARWGHFVEAGIETEVLVSAGVAIDYYDYDSDNYYETAVISCAAVDANGVAITDEEELAVFYPGESGSDKWEIRPLNSVSISGGIATVTMWRHQLVQPALIEALEPRAAIGETDSDFLTTVDVYRRYNNPATQCTLIWDPNAFNCGLCSSTSGCCPVCGQTTQAGCLSPKDYEAGYLTYRAATYDADDDEWSSDDLECGRNPDQLLLYYRAGYRDMSLDWPHLQMNPQWARAVAFYALTLLDRDICDCAPIKGISDKWRQDLALNTAGGTSFQLNDKVLNNPLGTTRAAVMVWNMITDENRRLALPVAY